MMSKSKYDLWFTESDPDHIREMQLARLMDYAEEFEKMQLEKGLVQ